MPEQQDGSGGAGKPDRDTLPDAPVKPNGNQAVPPNLTSNAAANNANDAGKIAKQIKSGEKWLIGIGVATLIINTAIGFIYWQQLQEMVGVSGQTDSLTRAYRKQERDIALLAQETHNLAESSKSQSIATRAIAENTAKANRAWVGIDGPLILDAAPSLTHDVAPDGTNATASILIGFHFAIKNFGRDPAFVVDIVPHVPIPEPTTAFYDRLPVQQSLACSRADEQTNSKDKTARTVVFPDTTFTANYLGLSNMEGGQNVKPIDPRNVLTVVGCIAYRDQFKQLHHTKFCYRSAGAIGDLIAGSELRHCTRFQSAD